MKKTFALILALVMILCILGGCTAQEAEENTLCRDCIPEHRVPAEHRCSDRRD